jgi:hypothetical protein
VIGDRRHNQGPVSFVELMMPTPMALAANMVEIVNRQGIRMTVRLDPHGGKFMADLVEVFLRQER